MASKKLLTRAGIGLIILIVALLIAYAAALRLLKQQIIHALGPDGEVQSIELSLNAVEIHGLRVKADSPLHKRLGWPSHEELSAERVRVEPDLRSLLSDTIIIRSIDVDKAAIPMLRTSKGLQIVPGLRAPKETDKEEAADSAPKSTRKIHFAHIAFHDSQVDFYDGTVAHKPHLIPLNHIEGELNDLVLPDMEEKAELKIQAQIGDNAAGQASLKGWLTPATLDSQLKLSLADIPLVLLEPYLIKAADSHVKRGSFSLELDSKVHQRKLQAPGKLALDHMELSGNGGMGGMARNAAIALLRDRRERIDLAFSLKGDLDDPKFSLNEEFYKRVGSALAESLGIGVEDLGKGASSVTQSIGGAIKGLFK